MRLPQSDSRCERTAWIAYLGVAVLLAAAAFVRPRYNWDFLAYVGLVAEMDHAGHLAHRIAYAEAQRKMSVVILMNNTTGSRYRQETFANPEAFGRELSWYRQRVLYVAAAYALHLLGLHEGDAVIAISALAYFGIALVMAIWIARYLPLGISLTVCALGIVTVPFSTTARLATPDALYALTVLLAMYFVMEGSRRALAVGFLFLSLLIRSDGILLSVPTFAYLALAAPERVRLSRPTALLSATCAVISSFALSHLTHHPGWVALLRQSFLSDEINQALPRGTLPISLYLKILASGLHPSTVSPWPFVFSFVLGFSYLASKRSWDLACLYVAALMVGATVLKYLVFPSLDDRHTLPLDMMFLILAARLSSFGVPLTREAEDSKAAGTLTRDAGSPAPQSVPLR